MIASADRKAAYVNEQLEDRLALSLLKKGKPDARQQMLIPHEAALHICVAAGVMTAEQAAMWQTRFARAGDALALPDSAVATKETRARARELLQTLVASEDAALQMVTTMWTLSRIGVISDAERERWLERATPPARPPRNPPPRGPRCDATDLQRVIAGPPEPVNAVRLICTELYADCVLLRWQRLLTPEETIARGHFDQFADFPYSLIERHRRWGADFHLHDDRNTAYQRSGPVPGWIGEYNEWTSFSADKPTPVWGYTLFVPAVPTDATRLDAVTGTDTFGVRLS